jgi:hypothetical protein
MSLPWAGTETSRKKGHKETLPPTFQTHVTDNELHHGTDERDGVDRTEIGCQHHPPSAADTAPATPNLWFIPRRRQ